MIRSGVAAASQQGQTAQDGMGSDRRPMLDPLGRQTDGNGNMITMGDPLAEGIDPWCRSSNRA